MVQLASRERMFIEACRIGHLATSDGEGAPSVVPVCFALDGDTLYTAIDEKPKGKRPLARLRNIASRSAVAIVFDHYDEDWTRLGWVLIRGDAEILLEGPEAERATALLRARYAQYDGMVLSPIIAIRMARIVSWGDLAASRHTGDACASG
ncbi:MAG TPA: TIGR03668 family PPOX class F420-dependent oxidoreductase [Rhizomicrobium sp.]|jgi:PPOX class probable F420-dependent enzyme